MTGDRKLQRLNAFFNSLTDVDISTCPSLVFVDLGNNQLASLSTSNNPALKDLYVNAQAALLSFDVSASPALEQLDVDGNSLISNLNLSNNAALQSLICRDCSSLATLVLSSNAVLAALDLSGCPITLPDITSMPELVYSEGA